MSDGVFFMVWRQGGGVPTVQHPTLGLAEAEAERLARANPGREFFVLMARTSYKVEPPPPPPVTRKVLY